LKHVWAKPELKWDGFEPLSYVLDTKKVWTLPLTKVPGGDITTVGDITAALRGQDVAIENRTLDLVLKSESQEIIVTGPQFHLQMLELLHWFADRNISSFSVQWFYFDSDTCRKDPQEMYRFFLVAGAQIIDESYGLSDWHDNGFDPFLLMASKDYDPIWSDTEYWRQANDRFWYRKFYQETRTGQLMVLRPDEPTLYFYPEGRANVAGGTQAWLAELRQMLSGIRFGLWLLIVLVAIEIILRLK